MPSETRDTLSNCIARKLWLDYTTEMLQYWEDYEAGQWKTLSRSHWGLGAICSIKTENTSGCAAGCWAESNEFSIKWRTPVVYTYQILTIRKKKPSSHVLKMWEAFEKSCIQSGYFAEKEEPSLVRENSNGTIYSKTLLENLIWQRISAGIFLIFPDVILPLSRKGREGGSICCS